MNAYLEKLVKERTAEVVQQKEEIEAQRDEIEAQRDNIKKQRDIAEAQRDLIMQQKKEITDSIVYAKRIQSATLPNFEFLKNSGLEYFVLFKPKDIVSGDFYWATQLQDNLIIVAADCTGHGVPGAFMSMLGISFLNEIVHEEKHTHPTEILNLLRDNVIWALQQKGVEGEAKDGMDISLVTIQPQAQKLYFAGANNPLLMIRNNELTSYDADKMPIAIFDKMLPFTTKEVDIQSGDFLYIFSDGYADQFGGPKGKKFMIKKFKEILLGMTDKTMAEQKEILNTAIEEWKGDLEQVDDILVIGIKVL